MRVKQAILVELFGILLMLFGTFLDLVAANGRYNWLLWVGLVIGIFAVGFGLFPSSEN